MFGCVYFFSWVRHFLIIFCGKNTILLLLYCMHALFLIQLYDFIVFALFVCTFANSTLIFVIEKDNEKVIIKATKKLFIAC